MSWSLQNCHTELRFVVRTGFTDSEYSMKEDRERARVDNPHRTPVDGVVRAMAVDLDQTSFLPGWPGWHLTSRYGYVRASQTELRYATETA